MQSLAFFAAVAWGQERGAFQPCEFSDQQGKARLHYQLYVPENYDAHVRYPMVLWLHDLLGVGNDNHSQIERTNWVGSHVWIRPENQSRYPAFVLAPQCPVGTLWVNLITRRSSRKLITVLELIDQLKHAYSLDPDRIYVSGQSLGGFATWSLLASRPNEFAAAVPIAGGGKPSSASLFAQVPIWAFHGGWDPVVPVRESRKMIEALRRAGGNPRYTELAGRGHSNSLWSDVFDQAGLIDWVFAQHRQP